MSTSRIDQMVQDHINFKRSVVGDVGDDVNLWIRSDERANLLPALSGSSLTFIRALIAGSHMNTSTHGLDALVALGGGATQGAANARAEELRFALSSHMLSVGTLTAAGEHLAADTALAATLNAIPAATTLGTSITLVNGLLVAANAHGASAGVHFHNDAVIAAATITVDPPVTLANVITDLNDLLTVFLAHFALAPTNTPV